MKCASSTCRNHRMAGEAWCRSCMVLVRQSRERVWKGSVRVWEKPALLTLVEEVA